MDGSINTRRLRGRDAAREFCRLIAGDAPLIFEGYFPREIAKAKDDHGRRIVGTFEQCRAELEAWEAEGRSVYLHPNPGGTKKGSIIAIRALSIEFDAPGEGHAQHHSLPAAWHIEPSAIVRRGASLQAHWLLSDCAVASFTELQTRAQRFYQSDARAIGEWRLWRMPGFKHPAHPDQDVELAMSELAEIVGPYSVATFERGIPALPREEPREPSQATGEPVPLAELRAMLSFIDPTFSGADGEWLGLAKAIYYGELPTNDSVDWEKLTDEWCSGELWRERTGDKGFFVPTYHDAETLRARLSDGPRGDGLKIGVGTIWKLAREGGYRGGRPGERLIDRVTLADIPEDVPADEPKPAADSSFGRWPAITLRGAAVGENIKPAATIIAGWIPAEGISALLGKRGGGKTLIMADMALCIASDLPWCGQPTTKGICSVYLCGEDSDNTRRHALAWSLHHKRPIPERFHFVSAVPDLFDGEDCNALAAYIRSLVPAGAPVMLFFDTWQRASGRASQKDDDSMQAAFHKAEALARVFAAPGVIAFHPPKDESQTIMGSSVLDNMTTSILSLTEHLSGHKLVNIRMKGDGEGNTLIFSKPAVVPIGGVEQHGKPLTGAVATLVGGNGRVGLMEHQTKLILACGALIEREIDNDMRQEPSPTIWTVWQAARRIAGQTYDWGDGEASPITAPKMTVLKSSLPEWFAGPVKLPSGRVLSLKQQGERGGKPHIIFRLANE